MNQLGICKTTDAFQFSVSALESYSALMSADADLQRQILDEFENEILEDEQILNAALNPIQSKTSSDEPLSASQVSLVDFLLKSDRIQSRLICQLLEKLPELFDSSSSGNADQNEYMGRRIMRALCWLPTVSEPQELSLKLLEILRIIPLQYQKELLLMIPEIIVDSDHKLVVNELKSLITIQSELIPPILDTLCQLKISDEETTEIQEIVLSKLKTADAELIPYILKFALCSASNCEQICVRVRNDFELETFCCGDERNDFISNFLESLDAAIQRNSALKRSWLKLVHETINLLDIVILTAIMDFEVLTSFKIVQLFAKAKSLAPMNPLTQHAPSFFIRYPKSLLKLGNALICNAKIKHDCVESIFEGLFAHCSDERQEIISSLVTHVGSGDAEEINLTLSVLQFLVHNHGPNEFLRFKMTLKSLLDYIDELSFDQACSLYMVLFKVAFHCYSNGDPSFVDELFILVRKQISHPHHQYVILGIAGIATLIRALPGSTLSDSREFITSIELLRLTCKFLSTQDTVEIISLLYSTIAKSIESAQIQCLPIVEWIYDNIAIDFQDIFVEPRNGDQENESELLKTQDWLDYDGEKSGIRLKNYSSTSNHSQKRKIIFLMCSLFDLLQACEKATSDGRNLDNIDGLLGCGIVMFEDEDECVSEETLLYRAQSFFVLIDWLITVINTFATEDDPEMQEKCVLRLNQLPEIRRKLGKFLERHHFADPFQISCRMTDSTSTMKKSKTTITEGNDGSFSSDDDVSCIAENDTNMVTLSILSRHFRKLELHTFFLASNPKLIDTLTDEALSLMLLQLKDKTNELFLKHSNFPIRKEKSEFILNFDSKWSHDQLVTIIVLLTPLLISRLEKMDDSSSLPIMYIFVNFLSWCLQDTGKSRVTHVTDFVKKLSLCSENSPISFFVNIFNKSEDSELSFLSLRVIYFFNSSNFLVGPQVDIVPLLHQFLVENSRLISKDRFTWVLRTYLKLSAVDLSILRNIARSIKNDSDEEDVEFSFLTKSNSVIAYSVVLEMLVDYFQQSSLPTNDILEATKIFNDLITVVKLSQQKQFVLASLKVGKSFIEAFQKYAVPVLDRCFRDDIQTINQILRTLQQATRVLQSICGYSKEHRDVKLTALVPLLKKALESFIFSIKSLLNKHGGLNAFWIGNLKHRNLRGEVIASQVQYPSSESEESTTSDDNEAENIDPEHVSKRLKLSLDNLEDDEGTLID